MTESTATTSTGHDTRRHRRGVSPWWLWYVVLGGTVAWILQLAIDWSVMEVTCIGPTEGELIGQRAGSPGTAAWWLVAAATVVPWLVAATAAATGLLLRRRQRRLTEEGVIDELATGRTELLLVVGAVLDLLALCAITGSGIALLVLEPCG